MIHVERFVDAPPAPGVRPAPPVTLSVSAEALQYTQTQLRELSAGTKESLVLWAGRRHNDGAMITHVITPQVEAHYDRLIMPNESRAAVAMLLRREDMLLFADLHTHPGAAFLSAADRARPLSTRAGFYAIVVPTFASGDAGAGWRYYESTGSDWLEVNHRERIRTTTR